MTEISVILKFQVLVYLLCCAFLQCGARNAVGSFKTVQTGPKPIWHDTQVDKLKKDLLMNYDRFTRPEQKGDVTELQVAIRVLHIEVDERKSMLSVESWLTLKWTDSKLKWNANDYGNISVIKVADHEIWQPDISLYNSIAGGQLISRLGNTNILIHANGGILWIPPLKLNALCDFRLRYWPFDKHYCFLKFGSWTYSAIDIKLSLYGNDSSFEVETTATGSSWETEGTSEVQSKIYPCCKEAYESVLFNITLTRKSSPYVAVIVTPVVVVTFFTLMQFWLPPQDGERMVLNGFNVVILNLFLLYFNHQVIGKSVDTPLIVQYYGASLYMVGFATLGALVSYLLCNVQKNGRLSWILRKLLEGRVGNWLLLEQYSNQIFKPMYKESIEEMKDHQLSEFEGRVKETQTLEAQIRHEWILLAIAIDRISFLIYSFVIVILAFVFFH